MTDLTITDKVERAHRDIDAAREEADSEARDKVGQALGLPYPGRAYCWPGLQMRIEQAKAAEDIRDAQSRECLCPEWLWSPHVQPEIGECVMVVDPGQDITTAEACIVDSPWDDVRCFWMPLRPLPAIDPATGDPALDAAEQASPDLRVSESDSQARATDGGLNQADTALDGVEQAVRDAVQGRDFKSDPVMDALQTGRHFSSTRIDSAATQISGQLNGAAELAGLLDLMSDDDGLSALEKMPQSRRIALLGRAYTLADRIDAALQHALEELTFARLEAA